jgi:hypothetical protein
MRLSRSLSSATLLAAVCSVTAVPVAAQSPAPAAEPTCTASRLVGTWERISLLRNGLSVQPPDAPLFVTFASDGYWSMMEIPDDRPKTSKPPDQLTAKELFAIFDKVEGGQGTWTVRADGSVVTRRHLVNIAPGGEGNNQDRLCWFEGEILALVGTGANRSPQARFKRLPSRPQKHALVGTWERTAHSIDGKPVSQPAPLMLILGEDGWYAQTQLPTGRKPVGKPMEQWAADDYIRSFTGVSAARGTYTIDGSTLTRRYVANLDASLVGRDAATEFAISGDMLTLRGTSGTGTRFEWTLRRATPLGTTQ